MTGMNSAQSWISRRISDPRIPAPQLALIEKDFNIGRAQCVANLLRSLCIL